MNSCLRILAGVALAMGLLVPAAGAQKPPAPGPPPTAPPPTPPSHTATGTPSGSQPLQPTEDLVMFLRGRVATGDGAPVPSNVVVERVCDARVRQQVYATSRGDFSMQLGSRTEFVFDASGDGLSPDRAASKDSEGGIPRRELATCELRASISGFQSNVVSLIDLDVVEKSVDVGAIVVQRRTKIAGMTLSATPYKAPREASKAYEKGLEAASEGKLANARQYFKKAVEIYPSYVHAWFQLGTVLQKENSKDGARSAYTKATTIDARFLPPYLSLASMAYEAENWAEVLTLTGHILDLDPLNDSHVAGYVLDLDPFDYAAAYFYNAVSNFKLNRIGDAQKSGLKAAYLDVRPRFPQVHLLLSEIFAKKKNYASAISEARTYLELVPDAGNADRVRKWMERLDKLNRTMPSTEKTDPQ